MHCEPLVLLGSTTGCDSDGSVWLLAPASDLAVVEAVPVEVAVDLAAADEVAVAEFVAAALHASRYVRLAEFVAAGGIAEHPAFGCLVSVDAAHFLSNFRFPIYPIADVAQVVQSARAVPVAGLAVFVGVAGFLRGGSMLTVGRFLATGTLAPSAAAVDAVQLAGVVVLVRPAGAVGRVAIADAAAGAGFVHVGSTFAND